MSMTAENDGERCATNTKKKTGSTFSLIVSRLKARAWLAGPCTRPPSSTRACLYRRGLLTDRCWCPYCLLRTACSLQGHLTRRRLRTTSFDNTYLPVLLEAFFDGSLMNDQLDDPVSLLIKVLHKPRKRYFALTLSWNFHCWINVTLLSWYFHCWINNALKSWIFGLVADLSVSNSLFFNSLLSRLYLRSKENISRARVEGAKMSYGLRLVYRSCVGRPRTALCFAKCRTILTLSLSLSFSDESVLCACVCVSVGGGAAAAPDTRSRYTCQHQSGVANLNRRKHWTIF